MTNTTKTIYITPTTTRTFSVGEAVTLYVGETPHIATILGFEDGFFHYSLPYGSEVYSSLGMIFAQALTPWRRPVELLRSA